MKNKRQIALDALLAWNPSPEEVERYKQMSDDELDELASQKFLGWCDSFCQDLTKKGSA